MELAIPFHPASKQTINAAEKKVGVMEYGDLWHLWQGTALASLPDGMLIFSSSSLFLVSFFSWGGWGLEFVCLFVFSSLGLFMLL